jgi:hypothetical protein
MTRKSPWTVNHWADTEAALSGRTTFSVSALICSGHAHAGGGDAGDRDGPATAVPAMTDPRSHR